MVESFLAEVAAISKTGIAGEHAYRPALQKIFNALSEDVRAVNEPARVDVGAPDFVFLRDDVPIGHCEAKDLGSDIEVFKGYAKDQFKRYSEGFPNLIYTNCLDWRFYRDGELISEITIADDRAGIQPRRERFDAFMAMLREFVDQRPQTITSSEHLAKRMAAKAILIKDVLARSLIQDKEGATELFNQYEAFKEHLIHDISLEDFADMYAETIAYGMFAARLHDDTLSDFSRQEALELLPRSNPFLRNLFGYIAGPNLDYRISWIIDDLAKVFQATDVRSIMARFGHTSQRNDPFLHFYEDFLAAYNAKKREVRGVWYTPEPVVDFIVRAVDDVLKTEFGITDGLADNRKITIDWETGQTDVKGKPLTTKKEVHKVQILDPAAGTGTFLAQAIKLIAPRIQAAAPGMWAGYVEKDLIPRLHGFELLMASYAMCHMKLEMVLREYGYQPTSNPPRVSVYLTNSLEEGEAANQSLPFAQWLSNEVREANTVKRDMPIMCVIGNPPYRGESTNKGDWIMGLMEAYKQSPELKRPAQAKWLSDDYVKFIRFSEHLIEKNGEGILGFITNHSYLDNPTFLDMRQHLMRSFDRIHVLDLHGNAKKKEVTPDGKPDKNVFDIQQGVAIIIAVKKTPTSKAKKPAEVFHADLWGSRAAKYAALETATTADGDFVDVTPERAPWPFKPTDWGLRAKYYGFPSVADWFAPNGRPAPGIVTTHDQFAISWTEAEARSKVEKFLKTQNEDEARSIWKLCSQNQWNYNRAMTGLADGSWRNMVKPIVYRPFDTRYTVYDSNVAVHRRERATRHLIEGENIALIFSRQAARSDSGWNHALVSKHVFDNRGVYSNKGISSASPLYLYPAEDELDQTRRVNFDDKLYARLRKLATHDTRGEPDEVAVFDYIYGVLHCPAYRETYAEFLKIDFPRIPWPASPDVFWDVSDKGGQLRRLHLMEDAAIGDTPFPFTGEGDNTVSKVAFEDGKVWINDTQYFDAARPVSWEFHIGGYQPAQKWLKDRKGRTLTFDDVRHYQKILKILSETDRIMKTIEMPMAGPST